MESKKCLKCGKEFKKSYFTSKLRWDIKTKFCSKKCVTDYRKGTNFKHNKQFKKGQVPWNKGLTKETDERVKKISKTKTKYETINGEYTHRIEGKRVRDFKYRQWRSNVFQRDNWTCQTCGARSQIGKSVYLEAHHIKSWVKHSELRFELNNGITLCKECHKLTDNYKKQ